MPKEQEPIYLKILPDERGMLLRLVDTKIMERKTHLASLKGKNEFMHGLLSEPTKKELEDWEQIRKALQRAVPRKKAS